MFNFLHNWLPSPVALAVGPLKIYWYGLAMISAILLCLALFNYLARRAAWPRSLGVDLAFWLVVAGLLGARLYHVAIHWNYYGRNLVEIPQLWQGGLAIHGAVLGGALALYFFARRYNYYFWHLAAAVVAVLPLGQAIGRWGNYFNQELFGLPTDLPWGIPIKESLRGADYKAFGYFQPVFLYESILNLLLFAVFWLFARKAVAGTDRLAQRRVVGVYFIGYSVIRFFMEMLRIDPTPVIMGLRLPQLISILVAIFGLVLCFWSDKNSANLAK